MILKFSDYVKTVTAQEQPMKFLLSKILIRIKLAPYLTIKRKGYRLRFYPSALSRAYWINKSFENPILDFIHDYLRPGDNMVDAGANIGVVTLESALIVGSKGKVYSIEPHPRTFNFLKGNVALNRFTNIEMFNVALGDKNASILFSNKISDDQNSIVNESGISIPLCPLDELIVGVDVALLKIDVEGYEKFVLLGASKLLKCTKCICFEALEQAMKRYNYSIENVYDILLESGFQLFRIVNKKEISPITRSYRSKKMELTGEDLLAIKNVNDFIQRTNYKIVTNTPNDNN